MSTLWARWIAVTALGACGGSTEVPASPLGLQTGVSSTELERLAVTASFSLRSEGPNVYLGVAHFNCGGRCPEPFVKKLGAAKSIVRSGVRSGGLRWHDFEVSGGQLFTLSSSTIYSASAYGAEGDATPFAAVPGALRLSAASRRFVYAEGGHDRSYPADAQDTHRLPLSPGDGVLWRVDKETRTSERIDLEDIHYDNSICRATTWSLNSSDDTLYALARCFRLDEKSETPADEFNLLALTLGGSAYTVRSVLAPVPITVSGVRLTSDSDRVYVVSTSAVDIYDRDHLDAGPTTHPMPVASLGLGERDTITSLIEGSDNLCWQSSRYSPSGPEKFVLECYVKSSGTFRSYDFATARSSAGAPELIHEGKLYWSGSNVGEPAADSFSTINVVDLASGSPFSTGPGLSH